MSAHLRKAVQTDLASLPEHSTALSYWVRSREVMHVRIATWMFWLNSVIRLAYSSSSNFSNSWKLSWGAGWIWEPRARPVRESTNMFCFRRFISPETWRERIEQRVDTNSVFSLHYAWNNTSITDFSHTQKNWNIAA